MDSLNEPVSSAAEQPPKSTSRFRKEAKELELKARDRFITYIGAGFGLVVALAWNDAVSAFIKYFFPTASDTVTAKFIYALGLTIFVTIIVVYLERLTRSNTEK